MSKRKSDAFDTSGGDAVLDDADSKLSNKKPRVSGAAEASSPKGKKVDSGTGLKSWRDVVLEGEDEDGGVPVYDDCNDIRRKITRLQKEPNFKITHWLRDIGNLNSNSFSRFMKAKGPTGGAGNGVYYAAYVYFEKVRVAEGKPKTAKRRRTEEDTGASGLPLEDRRNVWVITAR